mgnify:FL=1|jgi:hypothetical protein
MRYVTKKKETAPPPEDKQLKLLEKLQKVVEGSLKEIPVKVETVLKEAPGYGSTVNELSGLLVTAIKQNQEITRVHAAQIDRTLSELRQINAKKSDPIVSVIPSEQRQRSFHMDVNRGHNGYIESVDGTIE